MGICSCQCVWTQCRSFECCRVSPVQRRTSRWRVRILSANLCYWIFYVMLNMWTVLHYLVRTSHFLFTLSIPLSTNAINLILKYDFPRCNDNYVLELDLEPFNATFPRPTRSSSIGNGVQFLNRHLSSIMFRNKESLEPLLDFLRTHKHDGHVSLKKHGFCWIMKSFFFFAVTMIILVHYFIFTGLLFACFRISVSNFSTSGGYLLVAYILSSSHITRIYKVLKSFIWTECNALQSCVGNDAERSNSEHTQASVCFSQGRGISF